MRTIPRIFSARLQLLNAPARRATSRLQPTCSELCPRSFHSSSRRWAIAHPITAHGPPPKAPRPAPEFAEEQQQTIEAAEPEKPSTPVTTPPPKVRSVLKRRFWKDVHVRETPEGFQVLLDTRPIRGPTKAVLTIPSTKQHLAEALALEWDLLASAQQALKQHLIPLTSLVSRANDILREDANGQDNIRQEILNKALRYFETDTLLCWVPEKQHLEPEDGEGLRNAQMRTAQQIIGYLHQHLWPGIEIRPVLVENSIVPVSQTEATIDIIRHWILGLSAYDLAGLERAIIASKSLLIAARLVVEWSENFPDLPRSESARFGVDEAARASSLEVTYQTAEWGEVEDTHDVDKEDLKRQLGSVVLLVSGK
ncbi:hypothetical protein VTN31DRAFT_3744 [Thermomyces dupontii]|uniref:uncharacterized protein n=1 Tax=Talaromyces thermophilus TaxID=28565 RepID=UPI003743A1FD